MTTVVGTAVVFPPHAFEQADILTALRQEWQHEEHSFRVVERLHRRVGVSRRHLAVPLEAYPDLRGFGARNDVWIRVALQLGEETLRKLSQQTALPLDAIDQLTFTTITGLAVPSIDARLISRLGLRADVKRVPLFGLGCVGGAAGVARVADYLRGHPTGAAVLLAVELCSLTVQLEDLSVANIISTGLFADGAAAVLLVGRDHPLADRPGWRVVGSRSVLFPDSERVMGWDVTNRGLEIVLSPDVPRYAASVRPELEVFLADHGIGLEDIGTWVVHPGGPAVLRGLEEGLALSRGELRPSWEMLDRVGNLSSASVLVILNDLLAEAPPEVGGYGLMMAMGPGFCAEMVLLQWG